MARILLCSSAVRVHGSQAYRKMNVTRERISRILELREIFLSIQTGFSLVNAAVACAILESISGLKPSLVITEPRYQENFMVNVVKCSNEIQENEKYQVTTICTAQDIIKDMQYGRLTTVS